MPKEPRINIENLKSEAQRLGFSACGVSEAQAVDVQHSEAFAKWLETGKNGSMDYMARNSDKRLDPSLLLPGAKSVITVALNYYPSVKIAPNHPQFAYYAYGKDYHEVMRTRLNRLAHALGIYDVRDKKAEAEVEEGRWRGLVCCDTVPTLDRYWAWRGGIGWIGRNTSLIIPRVGSFCFLGEIITEVQFDRYDKPMDERCGKCRRCIEACPCCALEPFSLDARRCLSYLTIENREEIPAEAAVKMDGYVYGCDRCQLACPHNYMASPTDVDEFSPSKELLSMTSSDWLTLSKQHYDQLFKGSAVKRAKYDGLMRNIKASIV